MKSYNAKILNALLILVISVIAYLSLEYLGLLDNIKDVIASLWPFIIGFVLSWLLRPLGYWLHRNTKLKLRTANIIAIFISIIVIVFFVFIIIPLIIIQIISLFDEVPKIVAGIEDTITSVLSYFNINIDTIKEFLQTNKDSSIFKDVLNYILTGFKGILSAVVSTTGFILQFVFGYIIAFYFINDVVVFYEKLIGFFFKKHKAKIMEASRDMSHVMFGYLRGLFLVCAIIFVFDAVGCLIIGIPAAILLALLAAILNVIPYVGPILGGIPIFIVALSVDVKTALLSLVVVFGAQFIEANFLQPKIMSDNTDLHPVTIIVGLTVFSALFGFMGMVIATPVLAMVNVMLRHSPWDLKI